MERETRVETINTIERDALLAIDKYRENLETTRQCAIEYIDEKLDRSVIFTGDNCDWLRSGSPREAIEKYKQKGPEKIKQILTVLEEEEATAIGGRLINLFYVDFCFFLRDRYKVSDTETKQQFYKYQSNCAQYAAFMVTFFDQLLPELEPKLIFGDARVTQLDGSVNKRRMDHFWVELNNGGVLDDSGIFNEMFDDRQEALNLTVFESHGA